MAAWCKEQTPWKRPWCWERLKAGGEGDDRGWDGWMASPTQWTWVCVSSGSWWWTGRPGVLQSTGLQRVGHNWATELTAKTQDFASHLFSYNPSPLKWTYRSRNCEDDSKSQFELPVFYALELHFSKKKDIYILFILVILLMPSLYL